MGTDMPRIAVKRNGTPPNTPDKAKITFPKSFGVFNKVITLCIERVNKLLSKHKN